MPDFSSNLIETDSPACVIELRPAPSVMDAFGALSDRSNCLLLDSAMQLTSAVGDPLGRFSFLMVDPFEWLVQPVGAEQPLDKVRDTLQQFSTETIEGLPPMQGGWAGLLGYDLNRSFEKIPPTQFDEFQLPALAIGCYDVVLAWDHEQDRAWIISQGFPETEPAARRERAVARAEEMKAWLAGGSAKSAKTEDVSPADLQAPQHATQGPEGLLSNFSREEYIAAVERSIEYIRAGDVFQINLAQRLLHRADCDSVELYRRLRECNPAPFGGYFDFSFEKETGGPKIAVQIVSASPERFVSVRDGVVETRPIKGTRRRTNSPVVDIHAANQLLASEKDRAENTMIVDLMRNDLSRVCTDDSVRVSQLCELESYRSVLHLVSAVEGRLKPGLGAVDLVEAVFPGGSITGAPKVRAMEIIAELEPTARGAYCGSLGYLGFDGNADLSILIRSITASGGWWQVPVGGGIVVQSDPVREYEETWTKAAGMLRAITMNETSART